MPQSLSTEEDNFAMQNFDENIPGEVSTAATTAPEPMPVLPAVQAVDMQKVAQLFELAKEWKLKAETSGQQLTEVQTDIQGVINSLVNLLEVTGLNHMLNKKEEVSMWDISLKITKLVKTIYRQKDDPNNPFKVIGIQVMEFLNKYGSPDTSETQKSISNETR